MTLLSVKAIVSIVHILFLIQTLPLPSGHARAMEGRGCIASEREALLSFKENFQYSSSSGFSLWRGKDCCRWKGVGCSNKTGHVVKLNLQSQSYYDFTVLRGEMNSSIATLRHLRYLHLNGIDFSGTKLPMFLGTLTNLRYLDLSSTNFAGIIPSQLGNLSHLQYLDLSSNDMLHVTDISWLPHLTSLKNLDMSFVDLSSIKDLGLKVNMLPNLESLYCVACGLNNTVGTLSHSNLTHLEFISLSENPFNSSLRHNWFWDSSSIKQLDLSSCGWSGPIPDALGNMSALEVIDLDNNYLSGIMPANLENLCNLQEVDLSSNNINDDIMKILPECSRSHLIIIDLRGANLTGHLPVWFGYLTNISYLDISHNQIAGSIPSGIGNITTLFHLDMSQNMLVGGVPFGIGNMNNLDHLDLSQNKLAGTIPEGLWKLSNLTYLDLGLNNFSGVLTKEHFSSLVNLKHLDLSQNSLKLYLDELWIPPFRLEQGYFGSTDMGPRFPTWLRWQSGISSLNISNTRIDDVLPHWFWVTFSESMILDLSRNQLRGTLPTELDLPYIEELNLSNNSFSGHLPSNISSSGSAKLFLYNNHFTGTIPSYICDGFSEINLSNNQLTGDYPQCREHSSYYLTTLNLKNNNLSGEFPRLENALLLTFLDLSHNIFMGSLPIWIADDMPSLKVLILRSNMFHGSLPKQLTKLGFLHYLDVAHNNISGYIPSSLAGFKAMARLYGIDESVNYSTSSSISTFIKDRELEYTSEIAEHIVLIDLSSNSFTGHIPKELSSLKDLLCLNLSNNQLSGSIPSEIGALRELESLDLSHNYFTGEIPSSLSNLTFLSCLNLSYNDLCGRIPSGQQLQTINDQYMYIGNPGLCGPPLLKNCTANDTNKNINQGHEGETHDLSSSLYLSLSTGFMVGLWAVFCAMLFNKTWRTAYFHIFDMFCDKVYVQVAISKTVFMRKFRDEEP